MLLLLLPCYTPRFSEEMIICAFVFRGGGVAVLSSRKSRFRSNNGGRERKGGTRRREEGLKGREEGRPRACGWAQYFSSAGFSPQVWAWRQDSRLGHWTERLLSLMTSPPPRGRAEPRRKKARERQAPREREKGRWARGRRRKGRAAESKVWVTNIHTRSKTR